VKCTTNNMIVTAIIGLVMMRHRWRQASTKPEQASEQASKQTSKQATIKQANKQASHR
jgi:hypothetical protein